MAEIVTALGLMSGTSLDGIDAAILHTDGLNIVEPGPWLSQPYDADFQQLLHATLKGEADVDEVERELTVAHAESVQRLLSENSLTISDINIIGFHGQTILHEPHERRTWQIGNGELLAQLTGVPVVNDFRSADVAAGGQGAPFAPIRAATAVAVSTHLPTASQLPSYGSSPLRKCMRAWLRTDQGRPGLMARSRPSKTVSARGSGSSGSK